ncbi:hypothetical protein HF086_003071 [Spodoptera exigua]|uniref:Uncharacterized protein n=1 Tax=Spodoptera exigua TaxID=7107 RepID=A0A922SJT3_SPOEX|nr:hypothetical protein HF086_003071 [Spodoptera exigua]
MCITFAAPSGHAFGQVSNVKPIKISASSLTKPLNIANLSRAGGKHIFPFFYIKTIIKVTTLPPAVAPPSPFAAGSSAAYNAASLLAQTFSQLVMSAKISFKDPKLNENNTASVKGNLLS